MFALIINLGLKSIRAIVFDQEGRQLFSTARPVHTWIFGDRGEQDAGEWVRLLHECLETIRDNFTQSKQIQYVTVTSSSSCAFGVDDAMNPSTPVFMVFDRRAEEEAREISETEVYQACADAMKLRCPASSPVAKYAWLRKHEPAVAAGVRCWLSAGDYLTFVLTGRLAVDPLNAEKCFHADNDYCVEALKLAGLSPEMLPEVVPMGTRVPLRPDVSQRYKFSNNAEFIVTTYDAICAVLGSSDGSSIDACDVSGTVTSVRVLLPEARPVERPLLCQQLPHLGRYIVGSSNNLGGGIIEWYKQFRGSGVGDDSYALLESQAESAAAGAGGVIFLPYLLGERAPFSAPCARATFFGLSRETNPADVTRAVFESTAFVTRDLLEAMTVQGLRIQSLTVTGGLARIGLISQIKADVTNLPVNVLENFESTSVGALLLIMLAVGWQDSLEKAARRILRVSQVIQPNAERHALYNRSYSLFKKVNDSLTSCYQLHSELSRQNVQYSKASLSNL
jgi:sugar (pentulose or hexulose) kinase